MVRIRLLVCTFYKATLYLQFKNILVYAWNLFAHLDTGIYWFFNSIKVNWNIAHLNFKALPHHVPLKLFFVEVQSLIEQNQYSFTGVGHVTSSAAVLSSSNLKCCHNEHEQNPTTEVVRQLMGLPSAKVEGYMTSTNEIKWKMKVWLSCVCRDCEWVSKKILPSSCL